MNQSKFEAIVREFPFLRSYLIAFEEEFGGEISDEDAQKITTVGEAVAYVDGKMKK